MYPHCPYSDCIAPDTCEKRRQCSSVIQYKYGSCPTIKAFSDSDKRIRGLMGPFGSGKSSGCVIEIIKIAAAQHKQPDGKRRSRFAVIRNTYVQLKDTTIRTFFDWVPPEHFGRWHVADHRYVIDRLEEDLYIEVLFRALDRPEQISNLLSLELTAAYVNEAREIPWPVIDALEGRIDRYPSAQNGGCVRPGIIMDTNPPDTDSWWYRLFEEKTLLPADRIALFKQPSGLSPDAENLPNLNAGQGYYRNMVKLDEDWNKVYIHGEYGYVKDGKPVYPEYADNSHCSDVEPVPGHEVYRGWDFGLMAACVFLQVLPDGRILVFDEMLSDSAGIDNFGDAVLSHCAIRYPWMTSVTDIGDPAGQARSSLLNESEARSNFSILAAKGINVEPGEQTLTIRLGSVKRALSLMVGGRPRFVLHSRCKMLRKGFQGRYQYRRMRITGTEERYHDVPDKNDYSHPHDALQYTVARLLGQSLRSTEKKLEPIRYPKAGIV